LKTIESYSNMVMFIPISIVHNDGVWQLEERLSNYVHKHISK
jgi:hypothetical protein